MLPKKNQPRLIGRREYVDFPLLSISHVEAKIDTGAYTSSIHCKHIEQVNRNGKEMLEFKLMDDTVHSVEAYAQKFIKNSFGEKEERFIIKTLIHIGKKKILTTLSLSDRGSMRYPVLIGRRLLKGKFIVDVNLVYTNGLSLKKIHTNSSTST
jgi:hypothetical protein